jgi:hypothetical protein
LLNANSISWEIERERERDSKKGSENEREKEKGIKTEKIDIEWNTIILSNQCYNVMIG